jgi:DUF4097 and DUF4098 domain-containing protein YvlB
MHTFNTPGPVRLRMEFGGGRIRLSAENGTETTVDLRPLRSDAEAQQLIDDARIEQRGDEVVVLIPKPIRGFFRRTPDIDATIVVPTGSDLDLHTQSGDLDATGSFGTVKVESGSGDLRFGSTEDARIQSGSGDIQIDSIQGQFRGETGSGDVRVRAVSGNANVATGSGDVLIDRVGGNVQVNSGSGDILIQDASENVNASTASGDLSINRVHAGKVNANTASGDVHIGVADGIPAFLEVVTITGDVHSTLEGSEKPAHDEPSVALRVNTASGDITLVHA